LNRALYVDLRDAAVTVNLGDAGVISGAQAQLSAIGGLFPGAISIPSLTYDDPVGFWC
jgi:hypothetical protein